MLLNYSVKMIYFDIRCYFYWFFRLCFIVLIISINIELSVIYCKYIYKWFIYCFEVVEEIKGKVVINIKIKCIYYKSYRSEYNFFFFMIYKGFGR